VESRQATMPLLQRASVRLWATCVGEGGRDVVWLCSNVVAEEAKFAPEKATNLVTCATSAAFLAKCIEGRKHKAVFYIHVSQPRVVHRTSLPEDAVFIWSMRLTAQIERL